MHLSQEFALKCVSLNERALTIPTLHISENYIKIKSN